MASVIQNESASMVYMNDLISVYSISFIEISKRVGKIICKALSSI